MQQARKVLWIFCVYWFLTGLAYMLSFAISGPAHLLNRSCGNAAVLNATTHGGADGGGSSGGGIGDADDAVAFDGE
eukprot:13689-Prymnesium_polylepis.1